MVLEQSPTGERSYDIYSLMLKHRQVFVGGEVHDGMAQTIIAQLLYLEKENPSEDITMYVNSPGGSVSAGLGIIDTMNFVKPDINIVVMGMAASMGAMITTFGTKGKRFALPNARLMFHQPSGGARGMASDIEIQYKEIQYLKGMLNQMVATNTGQPLDYVEKVMDRDTYMSAQQAIEFGAVDKIIAHRSEI